MASGVEFDEDKYGLSARPAAANGISSAPSYQQYGYGQTEVKGMAGWLIRKGWAKSASSANIILVSVIALNIIISILVILFLL